MLNRRQGLKGALALAGLAAAPDPGGAWAEDAPSPAVIPLSEQGARFLVDVAINGRPGYRFVLDTGASTHFVSTRLVEALGLPHVDSRMGRSYQGRAPAIVVGVESLVVGGTALGRTDMVAWTPERLEGHDGLIGYPFLFPNAVLNLMAGQLSLGGGAPGALVHVEAQVMRNQTLLIGVVGGEQGRFVFDTGAQDTVVSPAYLRRIGRTDAFKAAPKLVSRNAEGETEIVAVRLPEMAFGDLRIAEPTLRVARGDAGAGALFDGVDGLFGISLIRPYAWALDQMRKSLRAGPAAA